jgi:hypothetical protein
MSTTKRKMKRIREQAIASVSVPQTVEASASFVRKFSLQNYGGPPYETVDFFAARKMTCRASEVKAVSDTLFLECVAEVEATARLYLVEMKRKIAERRNGRAPAPAVHPAAASNARAFEEYQARHAASAEFTEPGGEKI